MIYLNKLKSIESKLKEMKETINDIYQENQKQQFKLWGLDKDIEIKLKELSPIISDIESDSKAEDIYHDNQEVEQALRQTTLQDELNKKRDIELARLQSKGGQWGAL